MLTSNIDPQARLRAGAGILLIGIGQSNMQSAYPVLTYTPGALAGTGSAQTVTIPAGYSLRVGETVYAKLTGAVPAAYNDGGYVPYVVGGTMPSGVTLTRAGTATGSLTTAGTLVVNMRQTYPQAWVSQTDPAATAPFPPKDYPTGWRRDGVNESGSLLVAMRDRLASVSGRRVEAVDCSIGSTSLINQWVGFINQWNPSARFRSRRYPIAGDAQDRGHIGDLISNVSRGPSGTGAYTWIMMECTTGGDQLYATNASSQFQLPGSTSWGGGSLYTVAGGTSGSSSPNFNSITALGQTLTDGALTWTCVAYNYSASSDSSQLFPYADYRNQSALRGRVGFDPLGLIQRAMEEAGRGRRNGLVPVLVMVGHEGDVGSASAPNTWFTDALQQVADAVTPRRIYLAPSFTYFNTVSGSASWFATLSARLKTFLANNIGDPCVLQHALNLYDYFGQTPGSGGLTPQRDNISVNEDVHQSALTCILAGSAMADAIWQDMAGVMGS